MLQENLQTNENQYDTSENLGVFLELGAKHIANPHAQDGENEGRQPDDRHRRPQLDLNAGKRDAHRQSVDAGGDSQKKHRPETERVIHRGTLFVGERLANHVGPNKEKQPEGNPMVDRLDEPRKLCP